MSTPVRASSVSAAESNGLLKDLYEKKLNLRRIASEVGSMASELRDVRGRMATQESTLEQEVARRQSAEAKTKNMEKELELLHKNLDEKSSQATSTASVAEQYLRELVDVRAKLGSVEGVVEANVASATAAQLQYKNLLKEAEKKDEALQERDNIVTELSNQLTELQHELRQRESSQMHWKSEVDRLEQEMTMAVARVSANKDSELQKALEDLSTKNAEQLSRHLRVKDEEITQLREEIKLISTQLTSKTQELEVQMGKQRRADQELKKKIIKLEFWLQEARTQSRKLQRTAERKEKEIKELRSQLWRKEANATTANGVPSFWGSSRFKILMSVSVLTLFFIAKR